MWRCEQCGAEAEDHFEVCWSCGRPRGGVSASDEVEASETSANAKRCPACGTELVHRGERRLRHGGPEGWTLFREWRELDEKLWTVHVWACPDCRRLELYEDA